MTQKSLMITKFPHIISSERFFIVIFSFLISSYPVICHCFRIHISTRCVYIDSHERGIKTWCVPTAYPECVYSGKMYGQGWTGSRTGHKLTRPIYPLPPLFRGSPRPGCNLEEVFNGGTDRHILVDGAGEERVASIGSTSDLLLSLNTTLSWTNSRTTSLECTMTARHIWEKCSVSSSVV